MFKFTCFSACLNARVLCLSFNMANLCRLQVTWAPHVHKGRSTVVAILKGLQQKKKTDITSYNSHVSLFEILRKKLNIETDTTNSILQSASQKTYSAGKKKEKKKIDLHRRSKEKTTWPFLRTTLQYSKSFSPKYIRHLAFSFS